MKPIAFLIRMLGCLGNGKKRLPAIHGMTSAKLVKRIGFAKSPTRFLAHIIYFSYLCHKIWEKHKKGETKYGNNISK